MVNPGRQIINLADFRSERTALETAAGIKIAARMVDQINFEIHRNYEIKLDLIKDRLDAVTNKFRKCEMIYFLYFERMDHNVLSAQSTNFPVIRECVFNDNTFTIKKYFEVDDRELYQELIDYSFQEFILFAASVLENLVYLSETLVRKVAIHHQNNRPQSIIMNNFIEMLEYLHRLNYRNHTEALSTCLITHKVFLDRYLPFINSFRNSFIHGYSRKLISNGQEYVINEPNSIINATSTDQNVEVFSKNIVDNLRLFIPEFFVAITSMINAAHQLPA